MLLLGKFVYNEIYGTGTNSEQKNNPDDERRRFILQVVQPGLAGLMDGTVSSLAPLFAAAIATQNSKTAFLVGLATALGAGISMAFSEALSDDGVKRPRKPVDKRACRRGNDIFGSNWSCIAVFNI
jgi:rubrerythrin